MSKEQTATQASNKSGIIEDLTLNEAEGNNVKGGAAVDYLLEIDGIKGESPTIRKP